MENVSAQGSAANSVYSDILLDLSPNLVFFLTPENTICKISRIGAKYLNLESPSDAYGKSIFDLVKNPVLHLLMKKWFEKLNKGMEVDETFPLDRLRNDQYEWFHVRASNTESDGCVLGKVVFISDVTELYSQKKILDTLMSSVPGQVLVFDRTLQLLLVSDSVARSNGYHSWREVTGRSLRDLPKSDIATVESMLDSVILNEEPIHRVIKYKTANELRWFYVDLRVIKSAAGTFGYILTQFDIIGEIKPKAILEALMDSSTDAIAIVNPEGIVEYASRSLVEPLGFSSWHSVINHPWNYLFRHADTARGKYSELFSGDWHNSTQGTLTLENADGMVFMNYRIDPLKYQNENFGVLSIATNTTELVEARDRAEAATRAKASFLANMTHELRTPMNAVIGMNELLSRTALTPLQTNYISHVRSSATMLLSIINDILDFSRIEAQKMELSLAPYNLNSLLHDVLNLVAIKIAEKELFFTVDLDPSLSAELVGDEIRVKQILINLLNNAVKFTNEGGINLTIIPVPNARSAKPVLRFSVRDTGIGIPKDKQSELFGRFNRIENAQTASVEGSGLGLSICKGLVSLMNGKFSFESDEGAGSTFTAEIEQQAVSGSRTIAEFPRDNAISVLVYDSNSSALQSIERMAGYGGIRIECCKKLENFIEFLSSDPFPWTHVICEYKTGYEVAVKAAGIHSDVKWLSLLDMTDFIGKGKVPSIDFLFKPLVISSFARFLHGERVDFSTSLPLISSLGMSPMYFHANTVSVLVVDDNAINRKVAEGFLQTLDIHVDEAESGMEALRKAGANQYDLVLMDHMMPEMDGIEAAQKLRLIPGYQNVPIIALTANVNSSYIEMYRDAGFNDFLCKPVEFNAFVSCLKKWIPKSKQSEIANERQSVYGSVSDTADSGVDSPSAVPVNADLSGTGTGSAVVAKSAIAKDLAKENETGWIPGLDKETGIGFTGSLKNLEMILKVFIRSGPKMLEQLESGRRSGNFAQFRTAAHSLISSCANIGGTAISAQARELEQAIIAGKTDDMDRLYLSVHDALEKLIEAVVEHAKANAEMNVNAGGEK